MASQFIVTQSQIPGFPYFVLDDGTFVSITQTQVVAQAGCGCCQTQVVGNPCGDDGNCPLYLSTATNNTTGIEANDSLLFNYKCLVDSHGTVYHLTVDGWRASNGDLITYVCTETFNPVTGVTEFGYYLNGVFLQTFLGATLYVPPGTGTCPQANTCCPTYPEHLYMHITSGDCSYLNQVLEMSNPYLSGDFGYDGVPWGYGCFSPGYLVSQGAGGGTFGTGISSCPYYNYSMSCGIAGCFPGSIFCDNSSGSDSTTWALLMGFGAGMPGAIDIGSGLHDGCSQDPCDNVSYMFPDGNQSIYFPAINVPSSSASCNPIDITWDDIVFNYTLGCAYWTNNLLGGYANPSCCTGGTISNITFGGDFFSSTISFTLSGFTSQEHCKCCDILNGDYTLVQNTSTRNFEAHGSNTQTVTIGGQPLGVVPDQCLDAFSDGGIFSVSQYFNCPCNNQCTISFHVTEGSMMMLRAMKAPPHLQEHLDNPALTRDQKRFLLNKINEGIPEPIEEAPSLLEKIKSGAKALVNQVLEVGTETVSEQEEAYRLSKCYGDGSQPRCPFLMDNDSCSQCGCYVKIKAKMPLEGCPRHFWLPTKFVKEQKQEIKSKKCGGCRKK